MKNLTIITAIKMGFDFSQFENESMEEIQQNVMDFFRENSGKIKNIDKLECPVGGHSTGQFVSYDGHFWDGEIVDFSIYDNERKCKIYHCDYVKVDEEDGKVTNVKLWCWSK